MFTTKKKSIVLSKPADWDAWISFIKARGTTNRIWDLIDPNVAVKPAPLVEPVAPRCAMPVNNGDFNSTTYNAYKARKDLLKTDLEFYER